MRHVFVRQQQVAVKLYGSHVSVEERSCAYCGDQVATRKLGAHSSLSARA